VMRDARIRASCDPKVQFRVELLVGARSADILAIMKAWSSAFRVRCEQIEVEFMARMAG
jgi:hypothetical protein